MKGQGVWTSDVLVEKKSPWGKVLVFPASLLLGTQGFPPWWPSVPDPSSLFCSCLTSYHTWNRSENSHKILGNFDGHANKMFDSFYVQGKRNQLLLRVFIWLIRNTIKFSVDWKNGVHASYWDWKDWRRPVLGLREGNITNLVLRILSLKCHLNS